MALLPDVRGKKGYSVMKLESENVLFIEHEIIGNMDLFAYEGKEAEKSLAYIAGLNDMAKAVIKAINELGGK